jgi:hypothetical protein
MTSSEPPLSIEPVRGWRVWRLVRIRGRLALRSITQDAVWMPDEAMHATCRRLSSGHRSPGDGCTCGLYATSTPEALARAGVFNASIGVVGAIAMWGRVVEHGRGARSEFAYPARLRLVCGSCLAQGWGAMPPVQVLESSGGLIPVCRRHSTGQRGESVEAQVIEAELLSTFGVELLPLERVHRALRIRHRSAASSSIRLFEHPVRTLFALASAFFGAMMIVLVVGTMLSLAFSIIGGVASAMFGHNGPSPTAVVAVPSSTQPIDDVAGTVTVDAPTIVNDFPELSDDRQLITFPAFPALALLCGVGDGSRVDVVPCQHHPRALFGFGVREAPHGPATDCLKGWDAYSRGRRFWVCWERLPGAPEVDRWVRSANPWSMPVDEGGAIHEHR